MWASFPTKIKRTKMCTHEQLATLITVDRSYPRKLIPSKIYPRKFVRLRNIQQMQLVYYNCHLYVNKGIVSEYVLRGQKVPQIFQYLLEQIASLIFHAILKSKLSTPVN